MTITERPVDPTLQRLADVEARLAGLATGAEHSPTDDAVRSAPELASATAGAGFVEAVDGDEPGASRRKLLKLAAGAAAGGSALALSRQAGSVAAADGDAITIGDNDTNIQGDTRRSSTRIVYTNPDGPQGIGIGGTYDTNVFLVDDAPPRGTPFDPGATEFPAAVAGYGRDSVAHGVYGQAMVDGYGIVGHGSGDTAVGVLAQGRRANLEFDNAGGRAPDRDDAHSRGDMLADSDGSLWYCVVAGTPGTWRKVAGVDTAGSFHPVAPFRVFDSRRDGNGRLTANASRSVSTADARDVASYAVTDRNVLPDGATAVAANLAAVTTQSTGFLAVNPGGDEVVKASTLNWTDRQNIANAGTFALDDNRRLQVIVGPDTSLHLTIDITGYYL